MRKPLARSGLFRVWSVRPRNTPPLTFYAPYQLSTPQLSTNTPLLSAPPQFKGSMFDGSTLQGFVPMIDPLDGGRRTVDSGPWTALFQPRRALLQPGHILIPRDRIGRGNR
jgi:hypothetical protein